MEQRSQVTSVEAIEAFRSCLILFLSKARPTLEEVMNEVVRTRSWLQTDQRVHWEKEIKKKRRDLEQELPQFAGVPYHPLAANHENHFGMGDDWDVQS